MLSPHFPAFKYYHNKQLVKPLLGLVEATEETIASGDAQDDDEDGEEGSDDEMTNKTAAAAGAENGGAPLAVDNGDDALLLLRALAGQDEEVRGELKKEENKILGTSCTIM